MSPPEDKNSADALTAWDFLEDMRVYNPFGQILAKHLHSKGYTHESFAHAVNAHKSTVNTWVALTPNFKIPGPETKVEIFEALNLTEKQYNRMQKVYNTTVVVRVQLAECEVAYKKGNFGYVLKVKNIWDETISQTSRTPRQRMASAKVVEDD